MKEETSDWRRKYRKAKEKRKNIYTQKKTRRKNRNSKENKEKKRKNITKKH